MASTAEYRWLAHVLPGTKGPILEVGSLIVPGAANLRVLWRTSEYIGVDAVAGPGVDQVMEWPPADMKPWANRFSTVLCLSCLEHAKDPFAVARGLKAALRIGGTLVVSAPFVHAFHEYPDDYWRFTPNGMKLLFGEGMRWDHIGVMGSRKGRVYVVKGDGWKKLLQKRLSVPHPKQGDLQMLERMAIGLKGFRLA